MLKRPTGMAVAAIVLALVAIPSRSQDASAAWPVHVLSERATYMSGCFGPCLCPVMQAPMRGTFRLIPAGPDGPFNTFAVSDVIWAVDVGGAELLVGGSGKYKLGGEVAIVQQLELDLIIAGNPSQHFDSGLVPAGTDAPGVINVAVSMNHMACHDTAFMVDAVSAAETGIPTLQQSALVALGLLILIVTGGRLLHWRKGS